MSQFSGMNDRARLELLIYICLSSEDPNITWSCARELLGFAHAEEVNEWFSTFRGMHSIIRYKEAE